MFSYVKQERYIYGLYFVINQMLWLHHTLSSPGTVAVAAGSWRGVDPKYLKLLMSSSCTALLLNYMISKKYSKAEVTIYILNKSNTSYE